MTTETIHDETPHDDAPVITEKAEARPVTAYEKELRKEARAHREAAKQAKIDAQAEIEKLRQEHEKALTAKEQSFRDKHLMSELKLHATKASILDTDVLKLIDTSKAKFDSHGDVTNAAELIEEFRTAKPHLFSGNTSVATDKPSAKPADNTGGKLDWASMSPAERKKHQKSLGI